MTALAFESVSKHYRGAYQTRFSEDALDGMARLVGRGRPRPNVRALDDVSFTVLEGESYAIVGHNGAGKTTALKLATRVTYPTTGRVRVRGRVGALIEVGTGLHPELTGKENIHLYGNIMGLTRREIDRRFDDIVEFTGIGDAIAQPLKQYSSGMQLRLGFSVAAFLEPDVLLVDEAIAVGDAQFQARCIERMQALVNEGRTLIFVSHDMYAVEALCHRAVWLRDGTVVDEGETRKVIGGYLASVHDDRLAAHHETGALTTPELDIVGISLLDDHGNEVDRARSDELLTFRIRFRAKKRLVQPGFSIGISDGGPHVLTVASMVVDGSVRLSSIEGDGIVDCTFPSLPLQPRVYELWGSVRTADGYTDYIPWQRLRLFGVDGEVSGTGAQAVTTSLTQAPVKIPHSWRVE